MVKFQKNDISLAVSLMTTNLVLCVALLLVLPAPSAFADVKADPCLKPIVLLANEYNPPFLTDTHVPEELSCSWLMKHNLFGKNCNSSTNPEKYPLGGSDLWVTKSKADKNFTEKYELKDSVDKRSLIFSDPLVEFSSNGTNERTCNFKKIDGYVNGKLFTLYNQEFCADLKRAFSPPSPTDAVGYIRQRPNWSRQYNIAFKDSPKKESPIQAIQRLKVNCDKFYVSPPVSKSKNATRNDTKSSK
jgi:hypothetical protein